ncbi:hypothetical protein DL93DRAFT_2062638 [Clavulina sp. PMI_390]|nr:hypothetical protein DL93DRAFT_2062638 [Clavulina sp. PMI_390]
MPSNDSSTIHPIVNTENQQEEITVASDHIVADPIPCPPSALRPIRYKRVDPWGIGVPFCELPPPAIARAPAYLTLTKTAAIGTGHSARVWDAVIEFDRRIDSSLSTSAPAELPSPDAPIVHESITGTKLPPKLSVAAKIPYTADDARDFVLNEARIYSTLPPDLTRTFSGYTMPPRARKWQATATVAVAPKFYGYYMPDNEDGKNADRKPILLMEKCGKPVEIPSDSERKLLFSMLQRLHSSGFTQNSFSPRNILYQPGPLVLPPSQRSNRTPSFRIIDFGRGVCRFREVKRSQRMMSPEQEEERVALSLFRMRDF